MKIGAIGLADYLGFKGIWRRAHPAHFLKSLRVLEKQLRNEHLPTQQLYWKIGELAFYTNTRVRIFFLSDCLCVTATARNQMVAEYYPEVTQLDAILTVSLALSHASALSARLNPPLAFRGCVTSGMIHSTGSFLIGPAVDEAAMCMNDCQGALCWLTPTTRDFLQGFSRIKPEIENTGLPSLHSRLDDLLHVGSKILVHNYPVPLKDGRTVRTYVVNPLLLNAWGIKADRATDLILSTFNSPDPKVLLKRENTRAFLCRAQSEWAISLKEFRGHLFGQ